MPVIYVDRFDGGLNTRDLGHLLANNELTSCEGVDLNFSSVETLPGNIRELIDFTKYPEHPNFPGSAGGTPNGNPIMGRFRYYYGIGFAHNAWLRCHGETCEYWADGSGAWVTIGAEDWPDGSIPNAIQWMNRLYVVHGIPGLAHLGKWLEWNPTTGVWDSGDIPLPAGDPALANFCPSFGVEYKGFLYVVSQNTEPYMLRRSAVLDPENFSAPGGGWIEKGEVKGDPITGLKVHRDRMYVFRRSSVWCYWMDYYGNESMEQVVGAGGCFAHRSICSYYDALYYAGEGGMNCIYGVDHDCVSHKIGPSIQVHPSYIHHTIAAVHEPSHTLWVTVWNGVGETAIGGGTTEETGHRDTTAYVFNTTTWRADIRRPNILKPRWTKLPNYRITNYAFPPGDSNYRGNDGNHLHYDAQQPDVREWHPQDAVYDPAYINSSHGGPRHYSYRHGEGFDRDQIPTRGYSLTRPRDGGIGYKAHIRTRRWMAPNQMQDIYFDAVKIDYFVFGTPPIHKGLDAAWGKVRIDDEWIETEDHVTNQDKSWFPLEGKTKDPIYGGLAKTGWSLRGLGYSTGNSIMIELNVVGSASRLLFSHSFRFRSISIGYDLGPDKYRPDEQE